LETYTEEILTNLQDTGLETCDTYPNLMCNGADWWKRDKWGLGRKENTPNNGANDGGLDMGYLLETGWQTDANGQRVHPVGICHAKPGKFINLPGARNIARWFHGKTLGQNCAEVCAAENADPHNKNGELLAFDPVSMRHGGPKATDVNTFSHAVTELLLPGLAEAGFPGPFLHYYVGTDQPHQHYECAFPMTTSRSAGASNRGPFIRDPVMMDTCVEADDFGAEVTHQTADGHAVGVGTYNTGGTVAGAIFGERHYGCMDWNGVPVGMMSTSSCLPMCPCRDSYLGDDGEYHPIDVHENSTDRGRTALVAANEYYKKAMIQLIEWDNELKYEEWYDDTGGFGYLDDGGYGAIDETAYLAMYPPANFTHPPFDFPINLLDPIKIGAPAPELQLAYYCECPPGVHGKNCEIETDFCDPEHKDAHSYSDCVFENTHACIHKKPDDNSDRHRRHCLCKPGWAGSTCAIKDHCNPSFGSKCAHGVCMHESLITTLDAHIPPYLPDYETCGARQTSTMLGSMNHPNNLFFCLQPQNHKPIFTIQRPSATRDAMNFRHPKRPAATAMTMATHVTPRAPVPPMVTRASSAKPPLARARPSPTESRAPKITIRQPITHAF
jgi:hypothetical protein